MFRNPAIDLDIIPTGTIIYLPPWDSKSGETGHVDSVYTLQVVDEKEHRVVRMWRTYWKNFKENQTRNDCTGQGLVITLENFKNEVLNETTTMQTGTYTYMPTFYEGEGPPIDIKNVGVVSCIRPMTNPGESRIIKTGDIYIYTPEN